MCSSSKNLWIVCTYFATRAVPAKYALPYFPTCAVPARWVPPPLKFHNRTDVINYLTQVSKQMDFTKGFAIAVAESCEIELVVFSRSFHFPDWKMQFGAYTYPLHNQKCTVQKMKQSDLLLAWNKTNNDTGIGWYVVHGGIGFYCFDRLDKRSCWDKVHQRRICRVKMKERY